MEEEDLGLDSALGWPSISSDLLHADSKEVHEGDVTWSKIVRKQPSIQATKQVCVKVNIQKHCHG